MRTKQEIKKDLEQGKNPRSNYDVERLTQNLILEVLLDIRDIMIKKEGLKLCQK